ncbi:MAG: ASKHA domain-containing protein [Oscillospiraceae bacterium]|jgi:uncharacterized 2Fe-2S/4Fe-4S cluster protein (DUF4445 family)|nr:ASKHA domain-containing protein [Oscillospiraceae bacterium]
MMKMIPIAPTSKTVAMVLQSLGIAMHLPCGGCRRCGKCAVWVRGTFAPPMQEEIRLLENTSEAPPKRGFTRRLACFCVPLGDDCFCLEPSCQSAHDPVTAAFDLRGIAYEGDAPESSGVAIDIGTTTVTLALFDFSSAVPLAVVNAMNAQTAFGADVITRIDASNHGQREAISAVLRRQLNTMLEQATREAHAVPSAISRVVITGNTTMLHFLTQLDPRGIGVVPFTPQSLFGETYAANTVFDGVPDSAVLYLPPCVSAYIGADITCGMLAAGLCGGAPSLLADVGTNGEMALYADGKLYCCATAAGPAFEGAEISRGCPALAGAIENVWLDGNALRYSTIGNAPPIGICGTGLMACVAALLQANAIDKTGLLCGGAEKITIGDSKIDLTQKDIRQLQMAKAAVCAGIEILLAEADLPPETIQTIHLGGGFGSYMRPNHAAAIGLLPRELAGRAQSAGNVALTGAAMLLFSCGLRAKAAEIAKRAEEIQLAAHPLFAERYMARCSF